MKDFTSVSSGSSHSKIQMTELIKHISTFFTCCVQLFLLRS